MYCSPHIPILFFLQKNFQNKKKFEFNHHTSILFKNPFSLNILKYNNVNISIVKSKNSK